jgi:C_GCAxxG_C_C family probable redox protein
LLAVGEHYLGPLTEREKRLATAFAGGIGGTELEHCGVFTAGVMVISGLYGRTTSQEEDDYCQELTSLFRERFLERFGTLRCSELRASGYGSGSEEPCSVLVERAARILVEVIEASLEGRGG